MIVETYAPTNASIEGYRQSDIANTLTEKYHYGSGGDAALIVNRQDVPTVCCIGNGQTKQITLQEIANSLNCMHDQQIILIIE